MESFGIVTNVFRQQLDEGASLAALIAEAYQRGFRAFELRQGALGELESVLRGAPTSPLARLAREFSDAEFNMAIELPVFSHEVTPLEPVYEHARNAALELRGGLHRDLDVAAHLRLVDLTPDTPLLEGETVKDQAESLALLVADALASGVRVSLEHGRQPLRVVRELIRQLAPLLEASGFIARGNLGICFDPCNCVNSALEREDPVVATDSLPGDEIFMLHLKQSRNGRPLTRLAEGEVSWREVLRALNARDYTGPLCFETAPSANVWDELERSREYALARMEA